MKLKILIVEDDKLLAEAVSDYFKGKGWETRTEGEGDEAVRAAETAGFQMILLDVMLPGMDGFEVCRRIRRISDIPIFFITARVLEEDELFGYAAGADDYIAKPFSLPVLYAKVMAMMTRIRGERPMEKVRGGSVEINIRARTVRIRGEEKQLQPKEYELLRFFLENSGRIFTREQLLLRFWGYDFGGSSRVVDNHVKNLRKILMGSGCAIRTVRSSGYRMEVGEC